MDDKSSTPLPPAPPAIPPLRPGMKRYACRIIFKDGRATQFICDAPMYALLLDQVAIFIMQQGSNAGPQVIHIEEVTSPLILPTGFLPG